MPLFVSEEEFERCSNDASLVAEKADAFIRELYNQLETVKAQVDAASITAEQTCSLLEQKYVTLSSEFANLQSQHSQLNSTLQQRLSELTQIQSEKQHLHLLSVEKDGEIERWSTEASELHKSKRQLIELAEQKDLQIGEKNATIKSYLDKIANLTESAAQREARLSHVESELAQSRASFARLSQEKELIEGHNVWLNDELNVKVSSLIQLRKAHSELEADMSAKLADVERKLDESSSSLNWNKDRVRELELNLKSLQEELCSSKDVAAASEERFSAEISTITKLVELYKESSEEWSKKAGELEGVIRALETHLSQVENDYKEKLEKEVSARMKIEQEAESLKEKLEKCEAELERTRKSEELRPLALTTDTWVGRAEADELDENNCMLVPSIPVGISGTALAASLLREGWSLAKMYAKYQEAVDALRHEQLGRKQSQAILERVLYEIEEKAAVILDERAEHDKLVEAYSAVNQKLQHSLSEQSTLGRIIQELKADLKRHERDYAVAQKEIADLQKQVTILLKECRDVQLRCGSASLDYTDDSMTTHLTGPNTESNADKLISERTLTFKDINGLVEQNFQLRSLVGTLSDQIDNKEIELKGKFEQELQNRSEEAASKVNAVLARAEEQTRMIDSLHASVAMYQKLYEEEHKLHYSPQPHETAQETGRRDIMLLLEGSQDATRKAQEQATERVKSLEEDVATLRREIISLQREREKLVLQANFAQEKLDRFMKDYEHQRDETNGVIARNVEFSQLIIDYQRKMREGSESMHAAEELSRKLTMEVSVLKHEKELAISSEKRACDEVRSLSERVHRLQASLDTIQSVEEVREEARAEERRRQEQYVKQIEREWTEAKKELEEEHDKVRTLTLERESMMKNYLRQVEEMGKELSNALHSLSSAEARAVIAEARCSDLEKIKSSEIKVLEKDRECGPSSASADKAVENLDTLKEEIEKFREEAKNNKDHMLQYKSIAEVNEAALKQMELSHENFKVEAGKVKKLLEEEVSSLREKVYELQHERTLMTNEAASAAAGKEEALGAALSELTSLKEENSVKVSQLAVMEAHVVSLKDDLEKEHQRWRSAQANYERQVILQSETIQELTKTSQALASLQEEVSELRKLTNTLQTENKDLKVKWDAEKSLLEESKNRAEEKYNEINEQNMILHSRLEALHIKLAEKDHDSSGASTDVVDDSGLQKVVNYLRRSKEISETEISLLKQERLRLQSQLENALKAAETAQASLNAEKAFSRSSLFTEEEFRSLQLQVREMNLLRESNVQLREENKHNYEECQKLREAAQKARTEIERLEILLRETQNELEACRKEVEMKNTEKEQLEKRVEELLERCKAIDVEDYNRMKEGFQRMEAMIREKDVQLEEMNKLVSEKQDSISKLEQDHVKDRNELDERESRINEISQIETTLRAEVEKQKKSIAQLKKRSENFAKEKEELSKENQTLSKQLADSLQVKRGTQDIAGEQAMKEKEKDTRIQILEKTLERIREELRKAKDEHKVERAKRVTTQRTIRDSYASVNQERLKLDDELKKHKHALKMLIDEVEKLKHNTETSQAEGISVTQFLSSTLPEDLASGYILAVENFEQIARSTSTELAPADALTDASSLGALTSSASPSKAVEEKSSLPKMNVETRKTGRKLVRPRILRPEEPQGDVEMSESEGANSGKPLSHSIIEAQGNIGLPSSQSVRKRPSASSTSEVQEESRETGSDVPVLKKSKGSDSPQEEGAEGEASALTGTPEMLPATIEPSGDASLCSPREEEATEVENDELETAGEQGVEPKEEEVYQGMLIKDVGDERLDKNIVEDRSSLDNRPVVKQAEQDILQRTIESVSEQEEGELVAELDGCGSMPTVTPVSPEIEEFQTESVATPISSPPVVEDANTADVGESGDVQVQDEEKNGDGSDIMEDVEGGDKLDCANDQDGEETTTDQGPVEATTTAAAAITTSGGDGTPPTSAAIEAAATSTASGSASVEAVVSKQGSSNVGSDIEEAKQESSVERSSTTINLHERARQRAMLRQAGLVPSPSSSVTRGRGRAPRGRVGRGRGGRGHPSAEQG